MLPNVAAILVGLWLMISPAFLRHSTNNGLNAMVVGLLVATTSALAIWLRPLRYVSAALGAWMVATALLTGYHSNVLMAHDALMGLLIVTISGMPGRSLRESTYTDVLGPADHPYSHLRQRRYAANDSIPV